MKISELFVEDISRRIEGVVKVSDDSNLINEVREFVITDKIGKILIEFFSKYLIENSKHEKPQEINPGVWLSGFFGTGKSHLLKILSLVLSNREVDGIKLGDLFKGQIKDFELEPLVMRALRGQAQTILFNIDSVADQNYRNGEANIFMPFKKMFDRALGFSDDPAVAKMERDLIYAHKFDEFKNAFKRHSGKEWEESRGKLLVMEKELNAAFAEALGMDLEAAENTRKKYKAGTPLSVENFVEDIREYLKTKPEEFKLIFLVDEVGQYISRDPRTMLNLQTLVEDISVAFKGRVWVMVTAQEEVTEMVKTMNSAQKSDFSKILARFEVRPNLTSQNAQEVIKKRLLNKKPDAKRLLDDLFNQQGEVIRTKFTFPTDTTFNKYLSNMDSFTSFYPIVPYQVDLYQKCLISLSNHGAFVGNYASLGARSMLGVFQSALVSIKDRETGNFVPFDLFFEGTRALLKAQPYHTISQYESNGEDEFNVRLLKVLYLLKYVNEFPVTVKNIAVLLTGNSDDKRDELESKIDKALNQMVRYSIVQEVNGLYEYQTDLQQDVVKGIKATELQQGATRSYIADLFFTDTLVKKNILKLKHNRTGLDFPFSKKIDRHDHGKPFGEISLHLITGAEDNYPSESELAALSMAPYELLIVLPQDGKLIENVTLFLKTMKYASLNGSGQLTEEKRSILEEKRRENETRRVGILTEVTSLLSSAKFMFNGRVLSSQSADFFSRLNEAAQFLIDGSYIYLNKLTKVPTKADILYLLRDYTNEQLIAEFGAFNDVENELLIQIANRVDSGTKADLNTLVEHFKKIPYGYMDNLIIPHALVSLFIHGKVTIYDNVTEISAVQLSKKIDNSKEYASIVVKTNEEINQEMVATARKFYFDWFGKQIMSTDTKLVYQDMKDELAKEAQSLQNLLFQERNYPFLHQLKSTVERFERLVSFETRKFFEYINEISGTLLEEKDELDRIRHFMNGPNRVLYDRIKDFLNDHRSDLEQIDSDKKEILRTYIESGQPYLNTVYNPLNNALEDLKITLKSTVENLSSEMLRIIANTKETITLLPGYSEVPDDGRYQLDEVIVGFEKKVNQTSGIASLKLLKIDLDTNLTQELIQKIHNLIPPPPPVKPDDVPGGEKTLPISPPVVIKKLTDLVPAYKKHLISNVADVEEYTFLLKEKMMEEINKGNKLITG